MRKTYSQLHRELVTKQDTEKKLNKRIRTLRIDLRKYRDDEKRLIIQYERLIRDWRKRYEALFSNGWRIVLAKLIVWYNKKKGKKTLV